MAEPNLTELVATTLRHRQKEFADNVSDSNALLQRLNQKGNVKPVDGGRTIVQDLMYAENNTFKYYSGYEVLDIAPSQVFDAAEYSWKQCATVVTASGLEVNVQTTGKAALIDLLSGRVDNAMITMANNISTGIYSDGTGSGGKQITGLKAQVAKAPATGTVGGINRANFTFWRNQYKANGSMSASTIEADMQTLWISCIRGNDKPDLIIADAYTYGYFWTAVQAIQRINKTDSGVYGFEHLAFNTADVVYDGDSGIADYYMYFLNTRYIHWRPASNVNMVTGEKREPVNQDAVVVPVLWAGNLTMSNASLQGIHFKT